MQPCLFYPNRFAPPEPARLPVLHGNDPKKPSKLAAWRKFIYHYNMSWI